MLLVVLDGLSPRHVNSSVMPNLTALAGSGGWCREGVTGVMPTSTYPNHATLVTGVTPAHHGIVANEIPAATGPVPSWERGPEVTTLFDSMRAAGRRSAAVFGDQHLVGAMGAAVADFVWPEDGHFADDVACDVLGYAKDRETVARMRDAVDTGAELVVAQINEPDTAAHIFGPDSEEALYRYGRTDGHLASVIEHLKDQWEAWVVVVVSDHSQETVTETVPIDLRAAATRRGLDGVVVDEGASAVVWGELARDEAWLSEVPGVEGTLRIDDDTVLAWASAGRWFSAVEYPLRGVHGSPRTAPQVAVVTGGHPASGELAAGLTDRRRTSTWWAPAIAGLLGIPPPGESRPS
jgi:arylsulfatase A-like enzyme